MRVLQNETFLFQQQQKDRHVQLIDDLDVHLMSVISIFSQSVLQKNVISIFQQQQYRQAILSWQQAIKLGAKPAEITPYIQEARKRLQQKDKK